MALTKVQAEGVNLADTFAFTGDITGVGVSNLQFFKINTNITSTTSPVLVTAYTDGHDNQTFKRIGTAWSVSSGVFTPSASGLYEITFLAVETVTSENRYIQHDFGFSTDNGSNFTNKTFYSFMPHLSSGTTYGTFTFPMYFNISNPSIFRIKFSLSAEKTSVTLKGNSDNNESAFIFKRLADAQ